MQGGAAGRAASSGRETQLRHRGDARQRLAAKSECAHPREVIRDGDLRRGVTFDGELQFVRRDAVAVVRDSDAHETAALDGDVDACRIRVERVLHQFLDHRGRPFDDLARRNGVGDDLR